MIFRSYSIDFQSPPHPVPHSAVFVTAEDGNNNTIGSCQLHDWNKDHVLLCWLWVDPPSRGHGVGRDIIDHAIKMCQEAGKKTIALSANAGSNAKKMYEAAGFRRYGRDEKSDYLVCFLD